MKHWDDDSFQIKFEDNFLPEGWINFYFDDNEQLKGLKIELENPDFHFYKFRFCEKINFTDTMTLKSSYQ